MSQGINKINPAYEPATNPAGLGANPAAFGVNPSSGRLARRHTPHCRPARFLFPPAAANDTMAPPKEHHAYVEP